MWVFLCIAHSAGSFNRAQSQHVCNTDVSLYVIVQMSGFFFPIKDSKLTQQHTIEEEGTNVCNSKADQSKSVCHSHIKTSVHAVNKLTSVDELGRENKEDEEVEYLATSITKEVVAEKNQEVVVDDKTSSHNSIQLKHGEGDRVIDHDDEDDDDDDGGWITPENFKQICDKLGGVEECPVGVTVCCLTADYAMQVRYYFDTRNYK